MINTIGKIFPAERIIDAKGVTNRVLFAAADEKIFFELKARAEEISDEKLSKLMIHIAKTWEKPQIGENILTDDRAPVEMLSMRALDNIIQQNLRYYKEIYRREGLNGILNNF